MAIRAAHGSSGTDTLVRVETLPADELPALRPEDAVSPPAGGRGKGRPFQKGHLPHTKRKPFLASSRGIPLGATDIDYAKALNYGRRYRAARIRELRAQHGGALSAGVCALITSAALELASSRYLSTLAAKGDRSAIGESSRLAASARQLELTALEIASREAAGRPPPAAPPAPPLAPAKPAWEI